MWDLMRTRHLLGRGPCCETHASRSSASTLAFKQNLKTKLFTWTKRKPETTFAWEKNLPLSWRWENLIAFKPEDSLLLSLRCRPPLLAHQPIPGWLNADLNFNEVVHCEVVHNTALQTYSDSTSRDVGALRCCFLSVLNMHRCKKWQSWQIYLCYFLHVFANVWPMHINKNKNRNCEHCAVQIALNSKDVVKCDEISDIIYIAKHCSPVELYISRENI